MTHRDVAPLIIHLTVTSRAEIGDVIEIDLLRMTRLRRGLTSRYDKLLFFLLTSTNIPTKNACIISLASTECLVSSKIWVASEAE